MEQAPINTPIKGFQLYSQQTADMDLYSDPVIYIKHWPWFVQSDCFPSDDCV